MEVFRALRRVFKVLVDNTDFTDDGSRANRATGLDLGQVAAFRHLLTGLIGAIPPIWRNGIRALLAAQAAGRETPVHHAIPEEVVHRYLHIGITRQEVGNKRM